MAQLAFKQRSKAIAGSTYSGFPRIICGFFSCCSEIDRSLLRVAAPEDHVRFVRRADESILKALNDRVTSRAAELVRVLNRFLAGDRETTYGMRADRVSAAANVERRGRCTAGEGEREQYCSSSHSAHGTPALYGEQL